jgi:molecular chaperone GrpE
VDIGDGAPSAEARRRIGFIRVDKEPNVREDLGMGGDNAAQEQNQRVNADTQADGASTGASDAQPNAAEVAVQDAQRMLDEQRDRYLRLAAEFDNYRKRVAREREEVSARAQGELVKRLLESLDDLGRATSVNTEGVDARAIVVGVEAVAQKLGRALADAGLEVINPVDQPFNPELHEALATEPALSREDDHLISQVYQPGYVFRGQLLRPARVVVRQWAG